MVYIYLVTCLFILGLVVFWFDNPSSRDYCGNTNITSGNYGCGWTVRGKPAMVLISDYWGGTSTPPACNITKNVFVSN